MVGEPRLQNMICSTIKIMPAYKISVLYLKNQACYGNFLLVNVIRNFNFTKFWNSEISLKFWDFGPNFCMWPLNVQTNKCYIATWGQRWLLSETGSLVELQLWIYWNGGPKHQYYININQSESKFLRPKEQSLSLSLKIWDLNPKVSVTVSKYIVWSRSPYWSFQLNDWG